MPTKIGPQKPTSGNNVAPTSSDNNMSIFLDSVIDHVCCSSTVSSGDVANGNSRTNINNPNSCVGDGSCNPHFGSDCSTYGSQHHQRSSGTNTNSGRDGQTMNRVRIWQSGSPTRRGGLHSSPSSSPPPTNNNSSNAIMRESSPSLQESILPHLRFQPLPTSNSTNHHYEEVGMNVSSLDDFFTLFLANDALHSSKKFHEQNGDENVVVTPWKRKAASIIPALSLQARMQKGQPHQQHQSAQQKVQTTQQQEVHNGITEMERTISFTTRISPSSSSSRNIQNSASFSGNNSVASSFNTSSQNSSQHQQLQLQLQQQQQQLDSSSHSSSTLTLGVVAIQRLIQYPKHYSTNDTTTATTSRGGNINNNNNNTRQKYSKWILESQISFDYSDVLHSNNHSNNNSYSLMNLVGGKMCLGLSSFLISSDVKGSTVNVRVILREGDDDYNNDDFGGNGLGEERRGGIHVRNASENFAKSSSGSSHGGGVMTGIPENGNNTEDSDNTSNGCFSCFSHPLLLPTTEGLCGANYHLGKGERKKGSSTSTQRTASMPLNNSFLDLNEGCSGGCSSSPSLIGASLLNAIKAKNAPDDSEWENGSKGSCPITAAQLTSPENEKSMNNFFMNQQHQINAGERPTEEDVLASNTSRGSLKLKHISSFEFVRQPSAASASEGHMAMRRMILEKDEESNLFSSGINSNKSHHRRSLSHNPASSSTISSSNSNNSFFPQTSATSPTVAAAFQGLSMRIEMEVRAPPTASSSTSLVAFSRSKGSFTSIDDKVRRGLRKRVSRMWISWAESWCMRLWEEEEAERMRQRALGVSSPIRKRSKTNVRPVVRRRSKESGRSRSKSPAPLSASSSSSILSSDDWKTLEVGKTDSGRKERWKLVGTDVQSGEHSTVDNSGVEQEYGIEVACMVVPSSESASLLTK